MHTLLQKINHAGYDRYIIQPNPLRYDKDGDLIDDEHDPDAADLSDSDDNPWNGTRLEGSLLLLLLLLLVLVLLLLLLLLLSPRILAVVPPD